MTILSLSASLTMSPPHLATILFHQPAICHLSTQEWLQYEIERDGQLRGLAAKAVAEWEDFYEECNKM